MNAEERLAQIEESARRRQARRRQTLREQGLSMQNVWLKPDVKAAIDAQVSSGRFKSRMAAIEWALSATFEEKSA